MNEKVSYFDYPYDEAEVVDDLADLKYVDDQMYNDIRKIPRRVYMDIDSDSDDDEDEPQRNFANNRPDPTIETL